MPTLASPLMTLLASGSTSGAAPTAATDGVAIPYFADQATIMLKSTAGSGTMTATVRIWGYSVLNSEWYALGVLNAGTAIPEVTTADTLSYTEQIVGLRAFIRLAAEIIGSLGGSSTAIKVTAHPIRAELSSR